MSKLGRGALAYAIMRNRHHLFDLLVRAVKDSGMSEAQVAEQSGLSSDVVSRALGRPRNITWDTASRIMFATKGATIRLAVEFPIDRDKPRGGEA